LSDFGERLICNPYTPAQSKHTFQLLHVFLKQAPQRVQNVSILSSFLLKIWFLCEKRCFKNCFKKGWPARLKRNPMTMARGSLTAPLACAVFWTKTTVWARNNNSCSFLNPSLNPCPGIHYFWFHFYNNSFLMKFETKDKQLQKFLFLLSISKAQVGQWSDTLWAKARRINFILGEGFINHTTGLVISWNTTRTKPWTTELRTQYQARPHTINNGIENKEHGPCPSTPVSAAFLLSLHLSNPNLWLIIPPKIILPPPLRMRRVARWIKQKKPFD